MPIQINSFDLFLERLNDLSYLTPSLRGIKINHPSFEKVKEVVQEILPLLNLYQPFARIVGVGGGVMQVLGQGCELRKEYENKNNVQCGKALVQFGLSATIAVGAILQSRLSLIGVAAYEMVIDIHQLGSCIIGKKSYGETGEALTLVARHFIQLISVISPSPQMIVISMVVQILFEGMEFVRELKKVSNQKQWSLKLIVKVIVIGFHAYQLKQQMRLLPSLKPGVDAGNDLNAKMTKEEESLKDVFKEFNLYQEEHPNQSMSLEDFLNKNYSSVELKDVSFAKISFHLVSGNTFFKGMNFNGISFTNCNFTGLDLQEAYFKGSLTNCNLEKTILQNTSFIGCQITQCSFEFSNLNSSFFLNTRIEQSNFNSCSLLESSFYGTQVFSSLFQKIKAEKSKLFSSKFESSNFEKASFKLAQFTGCDFYQIEAGQANFLKANIRSSYIQNSNFSDTIFKGAILNNLITKDVVFSDSVFNYAKINHMTFEGNLSYVSFHDAALSKVYIKKSSLLGTSFLNTTTRESYIQNCDLTDCLLFDTKEKFKFSGCKTNTITRPIVALPWNLEVPGFTVPKVYRSIKEFHGIPLRIDYLPDDINTEKLDWEIKNEINKATIKKELNQKISIPAELIKEAQPGTEIYKIKQRAQFYMERVGAVILPGGNNIESEFYGGIRGSDMSLYDPDYRRSIFEFALLDQAIKDEIPVVAICRGHQLTNVFLGGTLKDVNGQWGQIQEYQIKEGIIQQLMGEKVVGVSTHRQAVDQIGQGLKVVVDYEGIIKATEGVGSKIYTFQFHPEWVLDNKNISPSNGNIFIHHIKNAKDPKKKFAQMLYAQL